MAKGFSDYECVSRTIKGVIVGEHLRPFQFAEIKTCGFLEIDGKAIWG